MLSVGSLGDPSAPAMSRVTKGHINMRILQSMISGILPRPGTRMSNPYPKTVST